MALLTAPSREVEVYNLKLPVIILVPFFALILQAFLPLYLNFVTLLDLPLLVILYFALTRRSQVFGMLLGAVVGMAQDSLSRGPIGLFGTAKTVVGYVTSSVSTRVDTESLGVRFLTIFGFYCVHFIHVFLFESLLLQRPVELALGSALMRALVNAFAGVLLFRLLDRFRESA